MDKINIIVKKTTTDAEIIQFKNDMTLFEQLRPVLECDYIEVLQFSYGKRDFTLLLDEEGKLNEKKGNVQILVNGRLFDILVGNIAVAVLDYESENDFKDFEVDSEIEDLLKELSSGVLRLKK